VDNFLLRTDSYKLTHSRQYPPDTEIVYSYLEARGGLYDYTVFFGLQYYLKKYLEGPLFNQHDIDEADDFCKAHFGQDLFNRRGWELILKKHGGKLPLLIKSVPEGTVVPVKNVLMTVENTDPEVPWLTNYVESLLLKVWYPTTVATQSREVKRIILKYLELTGSPDVLMFKLHDFGYRGVSSEESAAIGGAAHLVNFSGTDTVVGINLLKHYYHSTKMPGFSIPASEHSTITSWGRDHELEAYDNMLNQYPTGLVACVSDSYDIFHACSELWGTQLKDRVLARDGVLVIRPDSGDPAPTVLKVLSILGDKFGTIQNSKGFKLLDLHVRIIQGDGVNPSTIERILDTMKWQGWSADNITFGMGGALLQKLDRDTQQFAFKCSAIRRAGKWHDVYKTATGKESKRGRLLLMKSESTKTFTTINTEEFFDYHSEFQEGTNQQEYQKFKKEVNTPHFFDNIGYLKTRFENGVIYNEPHLDDLRQRAEVEKGELWLK
jgi:nicotinamide phosphoribosyltransferase